MRTANTLIRSDWAKAQVDLSLRWAHMSFCLFCHEAARITLRETKTEIWSLFWSVDKSGSLCDLFMKLILYVCFFSDKSV